jgi:hypothetical protein
VNHYESGLDVDIFLDRNIKDFFGEVCGETVRDPTAKGCAAKVSDACEEHVRFEWKRVVVVDTKSSHMDRDHRPDVIYVKFSVHEIGPNLAGTYFERTDGHAWKGQSEFEIGRYYGATKNDAKRGVYVLPHSDALVAAIEEIQQRIIAMNAALEILLGGPPEKVIAAASSSALQLAAPAQKENPDA